jgi:DNA-directed RNA polymerase subunit RPC12/RpoP
LDNYTDIRDEEYRCSECGATLFKTHHEAKDFLSSPGSG